MNASEAKDPDPVKGLKTTRGREKAAIRYLQDAGRGADVPKMPGAPRKGQGKPGDSRLPELAGKLVGRPDDLDGPYVPVPWGQAAQQPWPSPHTCP